jgi:IS605 OrfB family transposase
MERYSVAFDISAQWGYQNNCSNKIECHKATYNTVRKHIPSLPSSLVQAARDCACEALRSIKCKRLPKRSQHSALRYNKNVASVYLNSGYATLATVQGRVRVDFSIPSYFDRYDGWTVKSSNLVYDRGSKSFYLCVCVESDKIPEPTSGYVLGIDRGINNIAVTSANQFFNSKAVNNVRGRYAYLRKQLQSKGTRSAKRKLIGLSGRERRFKADVNHQIAKEIVNSPYGVFALEDLSGIRERTMCKKHGRKWKRKKNEKLGYWSFHQLEQFISYKAEEIGKRILIVDRAYTSQRCSRCGHTSKKNRNGSKFRCCSCDLQLHADLNASRNIAQLGISELSRLPVNQPNVAADDFQKNLLERDQLRTLPYLVE